jgi:predicted RNA binding protein YcfA (HicA-like mRNA interferase family)
MPVIRMPALRPERIVRALEACGLVVVRERGSHVVLTKAGLGRPVVVAMHNRELPPGTVSDIVRQADVSPEEFVKHV